MGLLGWTMLGLALWHFSIFVPDKFWGGIIGAFLGAVLGGIISGFVIYGIKTGVFRVPGIKATDIAVVLYAVPGALIGMGIVYLRGAAAGEQPA